MKRKVEFVGGPWDGWVRTLADPSDWMWLEGIPIPGSNGPRCYRSMKDGRHPYFAVASARSTKEARELKQRSYLYAGHTHTRCKGCGAFHAVRDGDGQVIQECGLCGAELPTAQVV